MARMYPVLLQGLQFPTGGTRAPKALAENLAQRLPAQGTLLAALSS